MKFNQILYSLENNNHSYFVVTFTALSLRALIAKTEISKVKLNCI